ncbi:monovalent cation/H+ antiporter subunit D family protein [Rhodococcus sp. HNM0569]|uniref:monovalent cation/H+ antiporter subunit D family protein n=1 Tax=Rhodococcus sp. HNM0569 TaxID=2716340 RepID=UPI00146C1B95|nr:monovalent cation/H+ antiporter subunit D family protein [Rhodococcus sp. HNM0569]NLU83519.1 monovalent cation/H+ antiporter subunit D family protein [Rhodococcus sp. HNM0569]
MTETFLPLAVAVPLLAAAAAAATGRALVRTMLLIVVEALAAVFGILLVIATWDGVVLSAQVGLWATGIAIPFVADTFAAVMITLTALLGLVCSAYGIAAGDGVNRYFSPLVLVLSGGVFGALLTGDLFNLFVFIEVMIMPSYGLIAVFGGRKRLTAGRLYVTTNLLTSTIFLFGVGLVYGTAGTVNLAELAGAAQEDGAVAAGAAVVLIALSVKAATIPVHGWLTNSYPHASPAVRALFSGLHTKVAVYAVYRIYSVVFDGDRTYLWIFVVVACITMTLGVLGGMGEQRAGQILGFHMVSQMGYIVLGVGLFGPIGLAAGIAYLLHHMVVKAALFMTTGAVQITYGSDELGKVRGLARREPWLAVAFFGAALSAAGLPIFSGFVAKLLITRAAVLDGQYAAAGIGIAVSFFTLVLMVTIWRNMFMGTYTPVSSPESATGSPEDSRRVAVQEKTDSQPKAARRVPWMLVAPPLLLTLVSFALGVGAEGFLTLADQAAAGLVDTSAYVEAVRG